MKKYTVSTDAYSNAPITMQDPYISMNHYIGSYGNTSNPYPSYPPPVRFTSLF